MGRYERPEDREARLDEAMATLVEAMESGRAPDRREWLARHPEFFDELSDFFEGHDTLERIAAGLRDAARAADDEMVLALLDPPTHPEHLGRLAGYEVTDWLGQGGMGVVFRAFDPALNRYVAIKVLAPQWSSDSSARRRFTREAQAAAAVSHPHVVTIFAVGEWRGRPYLVMEYIPGPTLQQRINDGPLELQEVLRIGSQVASGLAAAHAQGLIHRDVKPSNIMLENDLPRVKLTDFGLARAVDDARLTQQGTLAGTPLYMAPEQARGEPLDRRADLFSLGSVLYAMCTGRPAFAGQSTIEVIRRVCDDTPAPVRERNPDVPAWMAAIIDRLHAKEPGRRFATAGAVADLLERHLAHVQDPSTPPVVHDWEQDPPPNAAVASSSRGRAGRRIVRLVVLLGAAGVLWLLAEGTQRRAERAEKDATVHLNSPAGKTARKGGPAPKPARVGSVGDAIEEGTSLARLDESRLIQGYDVDFRGGSYDVRNLRIVAPAGATTLVKPDKQGVRIAIPKGLDLRVAVATKFALRGDFDVRAGFELLTRQRPTAGYGVGASLDTKPAGGADFAGLSRSQRVTDSVFMATRGSKRDGNWTYKGRRDFPTTPAFTGTLRLVRTGPTVHFLVAEGDGAAFREIYQTELGGDDMEEVGLWAVTGGSEGGVEVLWKDLSVRAEALPGLAGTPKSARPFPWWIPVAGTVAVMAGAFGLWYRASALRATPAAKPRPKARPSAEVARNDPPPQAKPAPAWDDEALRRVEERVAAYAREHPQAKGATERPRFQFGLRDGALNGPFVIWGEVDQDELKRLGANWEEVRSKLPVRIKGSYRNGKRDGSFVFRDGSGMSVFVEYRDGEPVV